MTAISLIILHCINYHTIITGEEKLSYKQCVRACTKLFLCINTKIIICVCVCGGGGITTLSVLVDT